MAEYYYPFCDIADFEQQSIAAVEQLCRNKFLNVTLALLH